jgi:flavin reductase (DIM6/NTAB) family NADH-FMN oxidoreductase RutF
MSFMGMMVPVTDSRELRNAFGCFPTGVTAVCALIDDQPVGMAASSFTCVSLDPPLVSVCVQNGSATWQKLAKVPRLGVSVLGECHGVACRQLASKTGDRFAGVEWECRGDGAVFIAGASVWLECSIYQVVTAGDHEIALLRIESLKVDSGVNPLVFHASRFRQLSSLEG